MSYMNAIDTNILIYTVDDYEPVKQKKAVELVDELTAADTIVVWQVVVGFLSWLRRCQAAGRYTEQDIIENLEDVVPVYTLAYPDKRIMPEYLQLHSRYSLSHWDSMLLAACIVAGVDKLYSEDMQHGTTYGSVTIENPFV